MENLLGIDETPSTLEQSFKAPIKLKSELTTDTDGKWTTYETFTYSWRYLC